MIRKFHSKLNFFNPIIFQIIDLCRNGSVFVWKASTGRLQFKETKCHSSDVASVKLFKNVIVSGGRDKFVKVYLDLSSYKRIHLLIRCSVVSLGISI